MFAGTDWDSLAGYDMVCCALHSPFINSLLRVQKRTILARSFRSTRGARLPCWSQFAMPCVAEMGEMQPVAIPVAGLDGSGRSGPIQTDPANRMKCGVPSRTLAAHPTPPSPQTLRPI